MVIFSSTAAVRLVVTNWLCSSLMTLPFCAAMMEATLYDFEDVTEQMNTMNEEAKATLTDLQ